MFHYHLYPEHQQRMKRTLVEEEDRPTLFGGLGSMLELGYQPSSTGTTATATAVASAGASAAGSVAPSPVATVAAIETNSLPCFTTYYC